VCTNTFMVGTDDERGKPLACSTALFWTLVDDVCKHVLPRCCKHDLKRGVKKVELSVFSCSRPAGSSNTAISTGSNSSGSSSSSAWDLRAQRRERQLWGECVRGLQAAASGEGKEGADTDATLSKVLDDLSTVRRGRQAGA
jgi:hypothetical protein